MNDPPTIPRLIPDLPFPPYTFIPGVSPHPISDPKGHSYGMHQTPAPINPDRWRDCREYLFGLDLFNHGFYWESHETWEGLWQAADRTGAIGDFLKGLIKLAAAGVKRLEGRPEGVKSHARRAAELGREVRRSLGMQDLFLGLKISTLIDMAERIDREGWPTEPVVLVPAAVQE